MTEIIVLKQFFENTLFLHCFLNNLFYKFTHPSPQKSDIHGSQLHVPIILHERVRSSKLMIREGFYPNTERFGQVLGVFCRTGCVCEGFQVVGLMICSGISVSFNVWSMLVSCFFFGQEIQKRRLICSTRWLRSVALPIYLVTYTSLIKGFVDYGMVDEAFSVLSLLQSKGLAPDIVLVNVMMIHTFY